MIEFVGGRGLVAPKPWPQPINTQTYCLTAGTYNYNHNPNYIPPNEKGIEVKRLLYKAYEAIHKYENFHGDTNRRSELNDRVDKIKEWMISQWPDIYGSMGVSGTGAVMGGFASAIGSLQGAMSGLGNSMAQAGVSVAQAWGTIHNCNQPINKVTVGQKIIANIPTPYVQAALDNFAPPKEPWHKPIKELGQKLAWNLGLYKTDAK